MKSVVTVAHLTVSADYKKYVDGKLICSTNGQKKLVQAQLRIPNLNYCKSIKLEFSQEKAQNFLKGFKMHNLIKKFIIRSKKINKFIFSTWSFKVL